MPSQDLEQERRQCFNDHTQEEVPKLTNVKAVIAYEYYNYGWEDAIRSMLALAAKTQSKPKETHCVHPL